jgi:hypothetical protein
MQNMAQEAGIRHPIRENNRRNGSKRGVLHFLMVAVQVAERVGWD